MVIILKGLTIECMRAYFQEIGTKLPFIRTNSEAFSQLLTELEGTGVPSDNKALGWVNDMLQQDRFARPTAVVLVTSITAPDKYGMRNGVFCDICCLSGDESDASDSLDDIDGGFVDNEHQLAIRSKDRNWGCGSGCCTCVSFYCVLGHLSEAVGNENGREARKI
jgi:hypothetical protein